MPQNDEVLRENEVNAPTLFIGVGGIGSQIVTRVAEMCKGIETENINFVCMDTNVNDLKNASDSKGSNIYVVQTSNTQTVGNYLAYDDDARKHWFPKNAILYDKTVSEGAGQVRAISRLAFNAALKMGKLKPLTDAIDNLFRKNGQELQQAMRIVFATTASGGTGSGLVLPLSMYVRSYIEEKYPNTALIIRSLILLPETLDSVIDSTVERESQRRNAYATIKEINAFMMLGSGFFNVENDMERFHDLHVDYTVPGTNELKRLALLPFDFCFLMDGQNSDNKTMKSVGQYIEQASMCLYEQSIGPMQGSAFSIEDNIIKELAEGENYGRNRFGGLGAASLRYPYEDVADFVAYQWIIDSIGGSAENSEWCQYDAEFTKKKDDAKNKGKGSTEVNHGTVYINTLNNAKDSFSSDLRKKFLGSRQNSDERVKAYLDELSAYVCNEVKESRDIKRASNNANKLGSRIEYEKDESEQGNAQDNLGILNNYEEKVRANAEKAAEPVVEALLYHKGKTCNTEEPYMLESLFHVNADDLCHPNAMRYYLYKVQAEMNSRMANAKSDINKFEKMLKRFGPNPGSDESSENDKKGNQYDAAYTKNETEASLPELCAAEKDPTLRDKLGGYTKIYEQFNRFFPQYFKAIGNYEDAKVKYLTYRLGAAYVGELCEEFEHFYATFESRTIELSRLQNDLAEGLAFSKGDSVLNVCATREMLDELCNSEEIKTLHSEDSMLNKDVNGSIFDAIKSNVAFKREIRYKDVVEEDRTIDIFGDILVGYYKNEVRDKCNTIDMNIVEAIAEEYRLSERIKKRKANAKKDNKAEEKIYDNIDPKKRLRYIKTRIKKGETLAAPCIQRLPYEEPREINLAAFNEELLDMPNFRVKDDLLPKGVATDSVSKYELRFYRAVYDLTPDKLSKFACYEKSETVEKERGLYHKAYVEYERRIGPDSTKNLAISTHIDKRWDSVAVMPEIDFKYQNECVMRVHQAMIYGLVHKAIKYEEWAYAGIEKKGKMVYVYENSDERTENLIVSNETLCDQFYEIQDALYISPSIVEDIETIKANRREKNEVRNSPYLQTSFKNDLDDFSIAESHLGETSLFEIPLVYYNSLPSRLRYEEEIAAMVEAVIQVFKSEVYRWENKKGAKFLLDWELQSQFALLIQNFIKCSNLNKGKKPCTSEVLDIVFRKIRHEFDTAPEPEDYQTSIDNMRQLLQVSKLELDEQTTKIITELRKPIEDMKKSLEKQK